jgi:hypothetical protein
MTKQSQQKNEQARKLDVGTFLAVQQQRTGLRDGVPPEARKLMMDVTQIITDEELKRLNSFPPV